MPHFSLVDKWSNQWIGATAMWAAQGRLKKKYNISDERQALFEALESWSKEVGDHHFPKTMPMEGPDSVSHEQQSCF